MAHHSRSTGGKSQSTPWCYEKQLIACSRRCMMVRLKSESTKNVGPGGGGFKEDGGWCAQPSRAGDFPRSQHSWPGGKSCWLERKKVAGWTPFPALVLCSEGWGVRAGCQAGPSWQPELQKCPNPTGTVQPKFAGMILKRKKRRMARGGLDGPRGKGTLRFDKSPTYDHTLDHRCSQ